MQNVIAVAAIAALARFFYIKEGAEVSFASANQAQAGVAYLFGIVFIAAVIVYFLFGRFFGDGGHGGH